MEPDDLYGLPLDRFVAERAALAKALRGEGRRDEAAQVAKLRKPSAAAWAVNQLARTQGGAMRALFEAGDVVRAAQSDVLAGRGSARALRSAGAAEREAVAGLVGTARGLLSADGHELSPAVLERVADTLHAGALDEAAREEVRGGRLERELRHVGLGLGEGAVAAPAKGGGARTAKGAVGAPAKGGGARAAKGAAGGAAAAADGPGAAAQARAAERQRAAAAAAEEAARKAARKQARAQLTRAARRAERAGHALRAAEERRDRAADALAQADSALDAARTAAAEAAAEERRAQAALDDV